MSVEGYGNTDGPLPIQMSARVLWEICETTNLLYAECPKEGCANVDITTLVQSNCLHEGIVNIHDRLAFQMSAKRAAVN